MRIKDQDYRAVWWDDGAVQLIEQRLLPHRLEVVTCRTYQETAQAIKDMVVRGAGAIGVAAGFAMAQAALAAASAHFQASVDDAAQLIRATRPTAHDLFAAVARVREAAFTSTDPAQGREAAVRAATAFADENGRAGEAMGRVGAALLRSGMRILTHCNAGWLAFADWGSALAPLYQACRRGQRLQVYAAETRPRSQVAKLT